MKIISMEIGKKLIIEIDGNIVSIKVKKKSSNSVSLLIDAPRKIKVDKVDKDEYIH